MDDTMNEAISISSPNGKVSNRAKRAAQERLRKELFGDGLPFPHAEQPTEAQRLRQQAAELRELAARGMKPRAYKRQAEELEAKARDAETP